MVNDTNAVPLPLLQLAALDRVMAMAEFSPDGTLLHANSNYLAILGLQPAQAIGQHHKSFCSPQDDSDAAYDEFWQTLQQGKSHSGIVRRLRHDGSHCWLEATYTAVRDDSGKVLQILKVATDVSQRVQAEQAQQAYLQRLSLVADISDAAILINDDNSHILFVNAGFTQMFGWQDHEVLGRNALSLLAPHLDADDVANVRAQLHAGKSIQREERVMGRDGQRYWAKVVSNPVFDDQGALQYTINLLTDITLAKMHERLQHRVLEAMAREQPLPDILTLICLEVESIAPEITASILDVDEQGLLHPLAGPSLPDEYSRKLDGLPIGPCVGSCGTAAWRNDTVCVDDIASDPLWAEFQHLAVPLGLTGCWSTPVRNTQGRVIGTFAFYFRHTRNVSSVVFHQQLIDACIHLCSLAMEREHARLRIRQLAFYDGLTGLPNRSLLLAQADQAISQSATHGTQLAVLFVDLDRFKQVNDSLGHPAGDELLRQASARLRAQQRPTDLCGRLSGDEFVVVLPGCGVEQASLYVTQLQDSLAEPLQIAGTSLSISASVGIAMFPSDGRDMETLLHRADMAMYQSKSRGRGSFSVFSNEMDTLAQERLALETALRDALRYGQLQLHYQPQIELSSGNLYGVEALARWRHPEWGDIPPSRFIPLAEECGLIADLGRWALREACRQLSEWRAAGLDIPSVSVNMSPTSFHNLALPRMIAHTLQDNALSPHDLTLELTEDVLLDTNPSTMQTIGQVHAQGVRLSMDDFGTGYSSLSYLRRLPVSELKLDRSFVADLEHDDTSRALSNAILGIGTSLRLTVVAEGVETSTQRDMLQEQGYPVAQGFLFSRPLSPDALAQWLRSQRPPTSSA